MMQALRCFEQNRRVQFAVVGGITLIGAVLRSVRYWQDPISLWLDEAEWAVRLLTEPLLSQAIRPVGFLWLARNSCELFSASEAALRLPSYLAGIAAVPLVYWAATPLLRNSALSALAALIWALHPVAIDFSREFKPYSFEAAVHLAMLAVSLRAVGNEGRRWVVAAAVIAPLAFPFAYNLVFLYPGLYVALAWQCWHRRDLRLLGFLGASMLVAGGAALGLFTLVDRVDEAAYGPEYWGRKYDVFLLDDRRTNLGTQPTFGIDWIFGKLLEMWTGPGVVTVDWRRQHFGPRGEIATLVRWLWVGAFVLGAGHLVRRQRLHAMVLLTPFVALVAANALGRWPLGFFRVNLFTLAYTTLIPLAAFSMSASPAPGVRLVPALFVVGRMLALPAPTVKASWPWMAHAELRPALERLSATQQRSTLILDYYSYQSLEYYRTLHPHPVDLSSFRLLRAMTVRDLEAQLGQQKGESWVLVSRLEFVAPTRDLLAKRCAELVTLDFGSHHVVAACNPAARTVPK